MTDIISAEIRGAHFRPPAKAVLQHLPSGTALAFVREPSNEFDANAIQVWVKTEDIPSDQHPELELKLAGWGLTLEDFLAQPECWLGFVGKEWAMGIAPLMDSGATATGTLGFKEAQTKKGPVLLPHADITIGRPRAIPAASGYAESQDGRSE